MHSRQEPDANSTTEAHARPADAALPEPTVTAPAALAAAASDFVASDSAASDPVASDPDPERGPRGEEWFERLFAQHATAVHRYLLRRGAGADAEDLAADVLTVAWRRRAELPDGMELAWLYRTAGFVLANHRRKGRPTPVAEVPDEPDAADPAVHAVRDERVREVLGRLSTRDRQVLLLTAWEGVDGDDLAVVLGVSRGGADAALSRARSRLREAWDAD